MQIGDLGDHVFWPTEPDRSNRSVEADFPSYLAMSAPASGCSVLEDVSRLRPTCCSAGRTFGVTRGNITGA